MLWGTDRSRIHTLSRSHEHRANSWQRSIEVWPQPTLTLHYVFHPPDDGCRLRWWSVHADGLDFVGA